MKNGKRWFIENKELEDNMDRIKRENQALS